MLAGGADDKVAERLVFNAYARAIQGFESYDTTGADGRGLTPRSGVGESRGAGAALQVHT